LTIDKFDGESVRRVDHPTVGAAQAPAVMVRALLSMVTGEELP
jgi:hypothetical protein